MAKKNEKREDEEKDEEEEDVPEERVPDVMSKAVKGNRLLVTRDVVLEGTAPIMFDRFPGDMDTQLKPDQKMYFFPDGSTLCIPALNISSFLSAENTPSAPKVLLDPRKYKRIARACLNYVSIMSYVVDRPDLIPLTRNGKPIKFGAFDGDADKLSGAWIHCGKAMLLGGIPHPKARPVIPCPWALNFTLMLLPNNEVQETQIRWLFDEGGRAIGLGTFRGVFGKFKVTRWA